MWSRPIRMALENSRFWSGSESASSQTADAWVMVTSFSTPRPATMMPQSTTEVSARSGAAAEST